MGLIADVALGDFQSNRRGRRLIDEPGEESTPALAAIRIQMIEVGRRQRIDDALAYFLRGGIKLLVGAGSFPWRWVCHGGRRQ